MLEFIKNIPHNIYEHFAAMTTLVLVATLVKIVIPLLSNLVDRYYERKSIKRLMERPGMTEERAKELARDIWRPKKRPSIMLTKLKSVFSKNNKFSK
ncbi:hypothetical protein [Atlantibacter hermannii]|uniref:hypothetical protein n=1 Tax=Atlantibacter hermannii TaxID=565 RepID=UPI003245B064